MAKNGQKPPKITIFHSYPYSAARYVFRSVWVRAGKLKFNKNAKICHRKPLQSLWLGKNGSESGLEMAKNCQKWP